MPETLVNSPDLGPVAPSLDIEWFSVLGVKVMNTTRRRAIRFVKAAMRNRNEPAASVFFVNAHTLNLAAADPSYRQVLNAAEFVFGDGTGVRWAARLHGVRLLGNLNGTDFVPALLRAAAGRGHSYFLLGADAETISAAADYAQDVFPGWSQAGLHHGYIADSSHASKVIAEINAARPDLLLVGMGNPTQERWIDCHRAQLDVAVCMGVGGLFDFWAGNVRRAPRWLRRLGHEWLWRLYQQPWRKAHRYLIGNPLFLARVLQEYVSASKDT